MRTTDFPDDRALTNAEQQLFLQRLRAAVWIILFSVLITTVEDAYGHPRILGWMLLIKLALMATVMVLAWSLRFAAARARPELIGLLGVTATCVTTAYLGVLRADLMTTHIVLMVIALAASAVLPWGLGPQLVAAGIALLSILASTYALTGRIGLVAGYPAAGLLIALLVILYVTHEFARYRRAIVRHSRELLEYREAVEHAHDLIYSAAPDGTLIFVNRSWREALGYHATDVAGLSMWTVVHPDSRVRYGEIVRRVMAGEDVGPTEVLFVTAHGAALTAEGTITCARDHGTVTATRGFFRDVTARQRAEEARRQSEQHFRSLIENAPDLITVMNADGTIKYDSPSYGRVLGYTLEERVGTNGFGLVHPDDASHVLDVFTRGMQVPGQSAHLEFRYRHKDGSWRYFESTGTNLLHDPAVAGVVVNSHDITERKQMEDAVHNSEEYLKLLFEYAPDAYYLNDAEGTLVDGNRAAEELTGYGREELRGQSFLTLDLIAGGDIAKAAEALPRSLYEPIGPLELAIKRKDGRQAAVEVRTYPVRVQGRTLVLGSARDVTERKRAETELQRAKEGAESASHAKSEFLAHMSHEIRTPMNGIMGMTDLLIDTPLLPEQREYVGMVKSSADALLTVINDILDFSKIEAGKLDVDPIPFALRSRLGDTIKTLATRAHEKGLELTFHVAPDVPDGLIADLARLRQVLVNLVGNAIKFTEQGEVAVEVGIANGKSRIANCAEGQSAIELHVAVRDTGIGIAPEQQERIFSAFEQGDASAARKYGGSGLGLTISSRLVGLLGGQMWVESASGAGSTFHFTVRPELSRQPVQAPPAVDVDQLRDLPVLVVDDNDTNRHLLREMLCNWSMVPAAVDGGRAALAEMERAAAADAAYPLVLLDATMPDVDGFAVAEQIQRRPALAGAAIMMLTSGGRSGDGARCHALGVTTHVTKPITQSDLLDAILIAVGQRSPHSELRSLPADGGGADARTDTSAATTRAAVPLHVLLAEDNVVNQRLAVRILEKRGHTVSVAATGTQAVAAFEREPFDVVLMDVQMPEMDGLEATAEIRRRERAPRDASPRDEALHEERERRPHIPIIAMTAHAMKGDEGRCLAAGMDGYICKPIDAQRLLSVIATLVTPGGPTAPPTEDATNIANTDDAAEGAAR